jgi:hypothetical protein
MTAAETFQEIRDFRPNSARRAGIDAGFKEDRSAEKL